MAPPKGTYRLVDDGHVIGEIARKKVECQVCYKKGVGIEVENIILPEHIKPSAHLIFFTGITTNLEDDSLLCDYASPIGVSCGCYARAHRQLAHIDTRMKFNGKV